MTSNTHPLAKFPSVVLMLFMVQFGLASDTPPPNSWMKQPTQESSRDITLPSIRHLRDEIFDKEIGVSTALTPESAAAVHVSEGSHYRLSGEQSVPEIPPVPHRTILIGTFTNFRSVLTPPKGAVYTDITIKVGHVVQSEAKISSGSTITISVPGGTITMADGRVLSYLTDPKEYFIEPGKKYLFVLSYEASGEFYTMATSWNLSEGNVKANSPSEREKAEHGHSLLVGLTEDQLVPVVQSILSAEEK